MFFGIVLFGKGAPVNGLVKTLVGNPVCRTNDGKVAEIALPLRSRWHKVLLRASRSTAIAFVVAEKEGFVVAIVQMWNYDWTA